MTRITPTALINAVTLVPAYWFLSLFSLSAEADVCRDSGKMEAR